MFNKNDPLIDSVTKIMQENQVRRNVTEAFNAELGIADKKALPHEHHAEYDKYLEEAIQEALKGNQRKIDANKNNKVDAHDFKLLRARKEKKPEEHGVEAEREMASKGQKMYEEEQLDERKMTDAEMAKREKIVKSMKKGMAGFKERYGERAKDVMYATATKQAMKEATDIDSIMEEIAHNLNEKAYKMLKAPFHEAAAWFNSLSEEQFAMLDEQSFMDVLKSVATGGGQNPSSTAPKPTTSLSLGGASKQASAPPVGAGPGSRAEPRPYTGIGAMGGQGTAAAEKAKGTASIATGGANLNRAPQRPVTPTPAPSAPQRPVTPTPAPSAPSTAKPGEEKMAQSSAASQQAGQAAPKNFGAAFAAARKQGAGEFEYGDKKFNTALKGETKTQTASALARARTGGRSGPTGR